MISFTSDNFSLKNRLLIQLSIIAAILSIIIFIGIRTLVNQTLTTTQDSLLKASVSSIVEGVRVGKNDIYLIWPFETFSTLGKLGEDRIFYRLDKNNEFLICYSKFPKPEIYGNLNKPYFKTIDYKKKNIRTVSIKHLFTIKGKPTEIYITVGQTQNFQFNILKDVTTNILIIVFIFFIISIFLSFITTSLALRPVNLLAKEVKERGPHDLQEVKHPSPKELKPLLNSLNRFIKRLQSSLNKTEIFIAEAAHHIKTPLTVVKSESELALRKSKTPENRVHLRNIIRSVDQTSRSSIQLLEHAMVTYRAEKKQIETCNINQIIYKIVDNYRPAANLRDINIKVNLLTNDNTEILLDRILLEVTLRNLIDNAIKYSPIEKTINIKSITNNNKYIIFIENVSLNIVRINKKKLLKRFVRGKNHKNIIGTGLGLAIVSEAVSALRGKFDIKIRNKKTLLASVLLPLK